MRGPARALGVVAAAAALGAPAGAAPGSARDDACAETYRVGHTREPPRIDGLLGDGEWPPDGWERRLGFPWREREAPETAFQLVTDGDDLYFAFRVVDHDVVAPRGVRGDESVVERGDRVELFLARDPGLAEYYSIEVDPRGRVLDYRGRHYRRFDSGWDCPGLEAAATERADGYVVEGRVPGAALEQMGLARPAPGAVILAGVFRAELSHRGGGPAHESWISWVAPQVPEPDFHVPSAFGCLRVAAPR